MGLRANPRAYAITSPGRLAEPIPSGFEGAEGLLPTLESNQ
jgi:hypothetical protein